MENCEGPFLYQTKIHRYPKRLNYKKSLSLLPPWIVWSEEELVNSDTDSVTREFIEESVKWISHTYIPLHLTDLKAQSTGTIPAVHVVAFLKIGEDVISRQTENTDRCWQVVMGYLSRWNALEIARVAVKMQPGDTERNMTKQTRFTMRLDLRCTNIFNPMYIFKTKRKETDPFEHSQPPTHRDLRRIRPDPQT